MFFSCIMNLFRVITRRYRSCLFLVTRGLCLVIFYKFQKWCFGCCNSIVFNYWSVLERKFQRNTPVCHRHWFLEVRELDRGMVVILACRVDLWKEDTPVGEASLFVDTDMYVVRMRGGSFISPWNHAMFDS